MPEAKSQYKLYSVQDLVELQDDPDQWIIEDMIPRVGRCLVYGRGGDYKTSIMFDLAIAVASYGKLLERLAVIKKNGPVVVLSTEGSIYTNRNRLLAYMRSRNLNSADVQLHYGRQPLELQRDGDVQVLRTMCERIRPVMIILDPLVSFCGSNENDTNEMKRFVKQLDALIDDFETSVVILHHANKTSDMRGSSVLQGWADSILKFTVKKDVEIRDRDQTSKRDVITITGEKQRDGATGDLLSAVPFFDKELRMTLFGVYQGKDASGVVLAYLKMEILKYLRRSGAEVPTSTLVALMKMSWQRVQEALDWLESCGLVERVELRRSTGGDRTRGGIWGYKASPIGTKIDAARAIIQARQEFDPDAIG